MNQTEALLARVGAREVLAREMTSALPNVDAIVAHVREAGDAALAECAARFGDPAPRRVPTSEMRTALDAIEPTLRDALTRAAERIERFARAQRDAFADLSFEAHGIVMGHRLIPIQRVGIYVPAGRHPLPSSLLMGAIPARVAGVASRAVCTPRVTPVILAAAALCGIEELYELGGPQAIAALAYGTALVPKVDLIVGPGNAYVTAAKRAVYGACGIDALAGASEIVVAATDDADARIVAADLLAQAEHDPQARAILITPSAAFADAVEAEVRRQLDELSTAQTARASLAANGAAVVVPLAEIPALCNALAPEHLSLQGAQAEALAEQLRTYGTLFIGGAVGEVFGDYGSGPNHVLPTNGSARYSSGLSVLTFLTVRTFERAGGAVDPGMIRDAEIIARAEGLDAHANAATIRLDLSHVEQSDRGVCDERAGER
ncbi:MAG: histidinol dehydrogenase [bacterium]|nr:histidinol dehydrogenase [bacterium]